MEIFYVLVPGLKGAVITGSSERLRGYILFSVIPDLFRDLGLPRDLLKKAVI